MNSSCKCALCYYRLTGRPSEDQWPPSISLSRDHFPSRLPKRPRDFNPDLCDFADDLLNVSLYTNHFPRVYLLIIAFLIFLANAFVWTSLASLCVGLFRAWLFPTRTTV